MLFAAELRQIRRSRRYFATFELRPWRRNDATAVGGQAHTELHVVIGDRSFSTNTARGHAGAGDAPNHPHLRQPKEKRSAPAV
jgi:hypothetical protein